MSKTIISTPAAPAAIGTYSQAVKCGGTVYLSGQIALDPATMQLRDQYGAARGTIDQVAGQHAGHVQPGRQQLLHEADPFRDEESAPFARLAARQVSS